MNSKKLHEAPVKRKKHQISSLLNVHVKFSEIMYNKLTEFARQTGRSKQEVIREALEDYFDVWGYPSR